MKKKKRAVILLLVLTWMISMPKQRGKCEWWSDIDWSEDTWMEEQTTESETGTWEEDIETEVLTEHTTEQKSEWEEGKVVYISDLQVMYEKGQKVYDGTCEVNLTFSVENLPENLILKVSGRTESSDTGIYPVIIEASLMGEGAEEYAILAEKAELTVEIIPKPLKLSVSDASRPYFRKNTLEELFFDEENIIKVEGFALDSEKKPIIPDDFRMPEITIDECVIQKGSPMYLNGELCCYEGALTIKENPDGTVSGNPGKNYIFLPKEEEYCKKGNIRLLAPYIEEGRDYEIYAQKTMYRDEGGNLWISPGDILHVTALEQSGFSQGVVLGPLYEGGTQEFTLKQKNKAGGILAESQIRNIAWNVDGAPPEGNMMIDGAPDDGEVYYTNETVTVQLFSTDRGSGLKTIRTYLAKGEECAYDPVAFYRERRDLWGEDSGQELTEEGRYCVFARLEDQVGNETFLKSKWVIVDRTAPQLTIENVEDGSANQGTVMPILRAADENLNADAIQYELTGFQSGKRNIETRKTSTEKGETIQMQDFPHEKDWDDVYQLEMEAQDLAGNIAKMRIRFSANRFGSTYYIEDALAEKLKGYYLKEPVDIVIHEWNVDDLVEERILIGYEEEIHYLEKGKDYTVTVLGNDRSIKEYIYRIGAEHFQQNGHYYVVFSSKDEADNYSDNRTGKRNVEFAVDDQAPVLVVLGVADGEVYDTQQKVTFECIENIELSQVVIQIDGKEMGDSKSASQEVILEKKEGWQSIHAYAVDAAGNESQRVRMKVWIGEKRQSREEIIEQTNNETEDEHKSFTDRKMREATRNGEEQEGQIGAAQGHPIWKILYFIGFLAFLKGILWFVKRVNG